MKHPVLLLLAVVVLSACSAGGNVTTQPTSPAGSPGAQASGAVAVRVLDFKIVPAVLTAPGPTITLRVTNDGPTIHNVTVRDSSGKVLMHTRDLRAGESETISATLSPGRYVTYCSLPGHESLGTKGTLTVSAP
ncbi:MAG: cupredoxin domain-containing protein [Chloroflexota bacterium]|nr:cupredoxin domain-containing protein [Chloroflexota bacterium]